MQVENGKGSPRFRRLGIMLDALQKRRFYIVLLMICAVSFALGYGSQVLREGPPHPETTANPSGSSSQPEAAVRQPLSQGASLIPSGAVSSWNLLLTSFIASKWDPTLTANRCVWASWRSTARAFK
jgi:hypothetical protein